MAEYIRVATFDGDDASLDEMVKEINSHDRPPEGVPAKRITVLADRAAGKILVGVRFGSEEDLRRGSETLDAMTPPGTSNIRRVSVEAYEVVLERDAP
jgi:hypothetical protein